ncbi:hypothetical protein PRIPAC_90836 [Pristionchus pacificus]|uniref:Uncharacterized protein n=1 Tax=Pristionchus pacificus TaxID=54126 RepID=A0A2A6CTB8_PRIPA|nr:hypothetical protein PRIPAC_90836 [Pristionchus pacificus]|eukprot:PDM81474.1 hypothetical protein PRIPAC_35350 [Pristionchus pacificus]
MCCYHSFHVYIHCRKRHLVTDINKYFNTMAMTKRDLYEVMCVASGMDEILWEANMNEVDVQIERGLTVYGNEVRGKKGPLEKWWPSFLKSQKTDNLLRSKEKYIPENEYTGEEEKGLMTNHDYHMDREENGQHEMSGMNQSNHDVDKRNGNIESIETKPLIPKLFALTNVKVENSMEILDFTQENGNTEHGNTGMPCSSSSYNTPKTRRTSQRAITERNDFIELASIVHDAGFDADAMEFYKPPSSKPPLNLDDITTL